MTTLRTALSSNTKNSNMTTTTNGMATLKKTSNACVDLFFCIGAMRGKDKKDIVISKFMDAFNENPLTAMKILFWSRDIRGGAGERQIFRDIIKHLSSINADIVNINIKNIPVYGRWDDLLCLFNTKNDKSVKQFISDELNSATNSLVAKWLPRKGSDAIALEKFMKLTPKEYRKLIVSKTNVVEQAMCSKNWNTITYEHVPSVAMARYAKAFTKNDTDRFTLYKGSDTTKVNSSALYPYDVLKTLISGESELAQKQWDSLPNYMKDNNERVLPVCDVSGSMDCYIGGSKTLTALKVCISLGLYISERNEGFLKDCFFTFDSTPKFCQLSGTLLNRYRELEAADWGGSTNLEGTFIELLNKAKLYSVPESEMPTTILIMSDMEFDSACTDKRGRKFNATAFEMIESLYHDNGYVMPKIVFWNLRSSGKNIPTESNIENVALVSGFSPAILKSVLSVEKMTPEIVMNKTINSERYSSVVI